MKGQFADRCLLIHACDVAVGPSGETTRGRIQNTVGSKFWWIQTAECPADGTRSMPECTAGPLTELQQAFQVLLHSGHLESRSSLHQTPQRTMFKTPSRAGDVLLACLACTKPGFQFPLWLKPCAVVDSCHSRTREAEAGESEAQGHLQLHGKFKACLGYMKPHLEN